MKMIMIADKPIWCAHIMNKDKLIEIRKNKALYKATMKLIEEQGYATFFMYCTKDKKDFLIDYRNANGKFCITPTDDLSLLKEGITQKLNGKVVAKFTVRKVEEFTNDEFWEKCFKTEELITKSCVPFPRLMAYSRASSIYAYHIEDLVIFDKPKRLCDFRSTKIEYDEMGKPYQPFVKNSPQNFIYIDEITTNVYNY